MYSREEEISSILASSSCFNNHLPGEVWCISQIHYLRNTTRNALSRSSHNSLSPDNPQYPSPPSFEAQINLSDKSPIVVCAWVCCVERLLCCVLSVLCEWRGVWWRGIGESGVWVCWVCVCMLSVLVWYVMLCVVLCVVCCVVLCVVCIVCIVCVVCVVCIVCVVCVVCVVWWREGGGKNKYLSFHGYHGQVGIIKCKLAAFPWGDDSVIGSAKQDKLFKLQKVFGVVGIDTPVLIVQVRKKIIHLHNSFRINNLDFVAWEEAYLEIKVKVMGILPVISDREMALHKRIIKYFIQTVPRVIRIEEL